MGSTVTIRSEEIADEAMTMTEKEDFYACIDILEYMRERASAGGVYKGNVSDIQSIVGHSKMRHNRAVFTLKKLDFIVCKTRGSRGSVWDVDMVSEMDTIQWLEFRRSMNANNRRPRLEKRVEQLERAVDEILALLRLDRRFEQAYTEDQIDEEGGELE